MPPKYRNVENTSNSYVVACERPDGTPVDPKLWWPTAPSLPAPTRPITAGRAGCVTGPGRPVVATTLLSVSANALDYRGLGDVSLETLNELGLRPDRRYTISLTRRQQRLLRAGTNVGRTNDRMTMTGPRWTELLTQLSGSASIAAEVSADGGEDTPSQPDSTAYHALMDAISIKLGGPPHPKLD